jgi:hypothetical protein
VGNEGEVGRSQGRRFSLFTLLLLLPPVVLVLGPALLVAPAP